MNDVPRQENRPSRCRDMPSGLWTRCPGCTKMIYKNLVVERGNVCPECDFHFPITSDERIRNLRSRHLRRVSGGPFASRSSGICRPPFLRGAGQGNPGEDRLKEACIVGRAEIGEVPVVIGVSDSRFDGLMGSVVGEKIAQSIELAREEASFIFVSGSGGGRAWTRACSR